MSPSDGMPSDRMIKLLILLNNQPINPLFENQRVEAMTMRAWPGGTEPAAWWQRGRGRDAAGRARGFPNFQIAATPTPLWG